MYKSFSLLTNKKSPTKATMCNIIVLTERYLKSSTALQTQVVPIVLAANEVLNNNIAVV